MEVWNSMLPKLLLFYWMLRSNIFIPLLQKACQWNWFGHFGTKKKYKLTALLQLFSADFCPNRIQSQIDILVSPVDLINIIDDGGAFG